MRSLQKRLEAVAKNYLTQTGRTSCASFACWLHSSGDRKIKKEFRFTWFKPDHDCQLKNFPDLESMEDFVSTEAYKDINDD